jgi:hypothetical protein
LPIAVFLPLLPLLTVLLSVDRPDYDYTADIEAYRPVDCLEDSRLLTGGDRQPNFPDFVPGVLAGQVEHP